MGTLIAENADISEEVELGRTLLLQGHVDTAQRVLLKVCQQQPEHAEAFRVLAMVLSQRGDDRRARPLREYADELDAQRTREIPASSDDSPPAPARQDRLAARAAIEPAVVARQLEQPASAASPIAAAPFVATSPPAARLTLPDPTVSASPPRPAPVRKAGRRVGLMAFAVVLCGAMAAAAVAYRTHGRATPPRPSPREELDRALSSGTLELLMRARDVARMALETGPPDADSLARLGLVNAFLVDDYAVEATKDAETALARVAPGLDVGKERSALVATARALLALAAGDLVAAKQQADAATAVAPDPPAFALLASARVRSLTGDAVGAARDLDRAMGLSPELAPVVVDWASSRLEGGDPVAARRALAALLERSQENSRALLSLADAERALGEPTWVKSLEQACKSDAKISRAIRAACAFEMASQARLDGDRAGALRRAKAVSQTSEEPQLLARVSLMLAGLGETDAAEDVLGRARKLAAPANVSLQWADAAIRLNRGEVVETSQVLEHPAGPERDLVALRAAYARQGVEGLAAALKALPPGILDIDWDVRAFSALAREGGPAKPELLTLEKRGEKGSPAISYVLGVLATRGKDFKLAMRRLEKALALHGDTCRAGMLYLDAAKHVGKRAQPNKAALRSIRAHNAKCPLPEL